MVTYQNLTPRFLEWFDNHIYATAWQRSKFLQWFSGPTGTRNGVERGRRVINGPMIQTIPEGLEEVYTTKWEKMKPGQIAGSLQEAPTQHAKLTQTNNPLMYLVTKIAIPVNHIDAWRNNQNFRGRDMPSQVIGQAMLPLTNQIDQFLCYGDDFLTKLSFDRLGGVGTFTGLFNGFQSFSGGDGQDDKMGTKGDYISTYVNARSNLRNNGFDTGPYYILTDEATQSNAEKGTHRYTSGTKPFTAYSSFIAEYKHKQGQVADWIESINAFPGSVPTSNRWCLTQPFISQKGRTIEPAYKLITSYNFRTWNLWNGGLNGNAEYEWIIAWSGRLEVYDENALEHTGETTANLDLTGV